MGYPPYQYEQIHTTRYLFVSAGKIRIEKVVDFVPYGIRNVINLGFGDLRSDGTVDDAANSNNGDIVKVLATIVEILKDFTLQHPESVIYFKGSTDERTRLYHRILKTYYLQFSKDFMLFGITGEERSYQAVVYKPENNIEYAAFLVKRIA